MDIDYLWEKFARTGSVEDYLCYCAAKDEIKNDYS
jgi:hypothetical protein